MSAGVGKDGQRLFFALWPSDEFRADLVAATQSIASASGGRVIPPENLHVTLLFLGQIARERLDAVQQAGIACANSSAFELSFAHTEIWGRANLLALTTSSIPPQASQLAGKLRDSLRDEVARTSEHEFRPHITLARDLPRRSQPRQIKPLSMKVNDFVLVQSRPGAGGSQYSVVARWPLVC